MDINPNPDLQTLHETLGAQHQALYEQLDTVPDANTADAIVTEMQEILHRMNLVQGLLFRATSDALKASLADVAAANGALTQALASAQKAADVIAGVSKFLGYVDKAIDLAKTLAPLAAGF